MMMTSKIEIEKKVLDIVRSSAGSHTATLKSHLVADLDLDVLDHVELVMGIEEAFSIEIDDRVQNLVEYPIELVDLVIKTERGEFERAILNGKRKREGPEPAGFGGCGPLFGLSPEYCPTISVVCIMLFSQTLLLTLPSLNSAIIIALVAGIIIAILATFGVIVAAAYFENKRGNVEVQRTAHADNLDPNSESGTAMSPTRKVANYAPLLASIFVPAALAAFIVLVYLSNPPRAVLWPIAFAYAFGFIGFLSFKYAENRAVLFTSFLGAVCLARGSLAYTFELHAETSGTDLGIRLISGGPLLIDALSMLIGAILILVVFLQSFRHQNKGHR